MAMNRGIVFSHAPLVAVLLAMSGCRSATSPWNGIWKLNPAKTRLQHPYSFTITAQSDGGIRRKDVLYTFDFRCDGKDYPDTARVDVTASCLQASTTQWRFTYKGKGKTSSDSSWNLSPDGTTLTIHENVIQRDGSARPYGSVYHRTGQGKGFYGEWQFADEPNPPTRTLGLWLREDQLRLAYLEAGEYVDAPLDGVPTRMHAPPQAIQGIWISIKQDGPRQMRIEESIEGRVTADGTLKLSEDGRTIVQETWAPDKPNEINTHVYEKQ